MDKSFQSRKCLYVFSASFPYGGAETFLEDEVLFLSKRFKKVVFIPLGNHDRPRRFIPGNCEVWDDLKKSKSHKLFLGIIGLWRPIGVYLKDAIKRGVFFDKTKFKTWLFDLVVCSYYMQSPLWKHIKGEICIDDVVYYYWGHIYNSTAPFLRGKAKLVSRFHGNGDLWNENLEEGYIPIRDVLVRSLDAAIFISRKGERFFKSIHPDCKTVTYHLGTREGGVSKKSSDNIVRVLSCSTVYPLKRVDLIFRSLNSIDHCFIEWTHIGGGKDLDRLRELSQSAKKHLKVSLLGEMPLDKVLNYYVNNTIDVFVNLSMNEGVPVSIMEAISFNVPIVAPDVGGISEIVTPETGVLLTSNPEPEEVADAIINVTKMELSPKDFWKREFMASKNYEEFSNFLYDL